MDIEDFWDWVKEHNGDCLISYYKEINKLELAIDERTLQSFMDAFVLNFEHEINAKIIHSAIIIDVVELLDNEFTLQEIWDKRISNLSAEW